MSYFNKSILLNRILNDNLFYHLCYNSEKHYSAAEDNDNEDLAEQKEEHRRRREERENRMRAKRHAMRKRKERDRKILDTIDRERRDKGGR